MQSLLESANGFHKKALQKHVPASVLEENINPNKHPYRYRWQAAYSGVVNDIRTRKNMRSAWQGYVNCSYCVVVYIIEYRH